MAEHPLDFDRTVLNKETASGSFEITAEQIRSFCNAIGETNPRFTQEEEARRRGYRGLVAPPTFLASLVRDLEKPDPKLSFQGSRLHAGEFIEMEEVICAGDQLHAFTRVSEVYAKTGRTGTMAFIVWETRFMNQNGQVAAKVRESFMTRPSESSDSVEESGD